MHFYQPALRDTYPVINLFIKAGHNARRGASVS